MSGSRPTDAAQATGRERWLLEGDEPRRYEQHRVPALFRPLAERLLEHVDLREGERVLDVACGTGVVARLVAPQVGRSGKVVGIDLNAGMLAVARALEPVPGAAVEWRQGDAEALPFPDSSFDAALCQHGLQFFPDRIRALREMHRVLVPGGRLGIGVWGAHHPYLRALSESLAKHVSSDAATRILAPLGLCDPGMLRSLAQDAGFRSAFVRSTTIFRRIHDPDEMLPHAGTPLAAEVSMASDAARSALVADIAAALEAHRDGEGYKVPAEAHFLIARA